MDIRKIKKLIELVQESGIAELEISEGEESVRINRFSATAAPAPMHYTAPALPSAAATTAAPKKRGRPAKAATAAKPAAKTAAAPKKRGRPAKAATANAAAKPATAPKKRGRPAKAAATSAPAAAPAAPEADKS